MATTRKSTAVKNTSSAKAKKTTKAKPAAKKATSKKPASKATRLAQRKAARARIKANKAPAKSPAKAKKAPPNPLLKKALSASVAVWGPDTWTGMEFGPNGSVPSPDYKATVEIPLEVASAADFTGSKDGLYLEMSKKARKAVESHVDSSLIDIDDKATRKLVLGQDAYIVIVAEPKDRKLSKKLRDEAKQKRLNR